jgi:hypothetical protein
MLELLAVGQGVYFCLTGIWPLIDMRSFEAATGPKADDWLVKTVGVQVAVAGAVLLFSGYRREVAADTLLLAVGSASGLLAIDLWYVSRGVIPRVYLLDAAVELLLIVGWIAAWLAGG